MAKKRDFKKEYREYHSKDEQKKNRAGRNKARKTLEKEGKVSKGDGKDVDHKNSNPKDNKRSNLRVMDRSKNRGRTENGKKV